MIFFFFFVFWGTGKSILLRQSDWKTSNKFDGSSSNHTSVSAIETALLAKEWTKLLPPLFTAEATNLETRVGFFNIFYDMAPLRPILLWVINSCDELKWVTLYHHVSKTNLLSKKDGSPSSEGFN